MVESFLVWGGAVSFVSTLLTLQAWMKASTQRRKRFEIRLEQARLTRAQLDQQTQRELEANRCRHKHWTEVLIEKTGQLIAFLCLDCNDTLYLEQDRAEDSEVWTPPGCHCRPLEEIYNVACPVQHHAGHAEVRRALVAAAEEQRVADLEESRKLKLAEFEEWHRSQKKGGCQAPLLPYRITKSSGPGEYIHQHTSDLITPKHDCPETCTCEQSEAVAVTDCSDCEKSAQELYDRAKHSYSLGGLTLVGAESALRAGAEVIEESHRLGHPQQCDSCEAQVRETILIIRAFVQLGWCKESHWELFAKAVEKLRAHQHSAGLHLESVNFIRPWCEWGRGQVKFPPLSKRRKLEATASIEQFCRAADRWMKGETFWDGVAAKHDAKIRSGFSMGGIISNSQGPIAQFVSERDECRKCGGVPDPNKCTQCLMDILKGQFRR
jgi:hypothetical protein